MQTRAIHILLFLLSGIFIISCGNDVRAPEIILSGKTKDTIELNTSYSEPGYTARDKKDGDITAKVMVSGSVNPNKTGDYSIKYEVIDKAGNLDKAERNVHVFNKSNYLAGTYLVNEVVKGANPGQYTYIINAKGSETKNMQLELNNFGSYGIYVNVKVDISGNNITIPLQYPTGMPSGSEGGISGNGEIENNRITKIEFICNYASGGNDTVTSIYTRQ